MTHFTCDRCGAPANGNKEINESVVVERWQGRNVEIYVNVKTVRCYGMDSNERPDLCNDCRAHILTLVAATLTPAPECVS